MNMDINLIRTFVTVAALGAFLAIVVWAYLPHRREKLLQRDREEQRHRRRDDRHDISSRRVHYNFL